MDPAGSYLRDRTGPGPQALYAIAADYDPPADSPLRRISRNGLTNLVFGREGNDLVVPTLGVHQLEGAAGFPVPAPLLLEAPVGVHHTTYFAEAKVGEKLLSWLG